VSAHPSPAGRPTSLGGPGVEGLVDSSLVGVSTLGYPSGQAGPSEISVCSDVQVSPYSLAIGIAETRTRTQLEASSPTPPSFSLRQPPIAVTETAAAGGLTLAPNVVDTPTRGMRRAPSVPARPSSSLRSLSPPVLSPAYGLEQPESVHHRTGRAATQRVASPRARLQRAPSLWVCVYTQLLQLSQLRLMLRLRLRLHLRLRSRMCAQVCRSLRALLTLQVSLV